MTVDAEKKTSVISVYVKASSPVLAQELVNEIMSLTCAKNLEVHAVKGSTEFFDTEFNNHDQKLSDAIEAQTQFRNENKMLSIDGSRNTLQDVLGRIENELITAGVAVAASNERVRKYTYEMAGISRTTLVPTSGVEKLSFEDSRTEMFKLQTRKEELAATFHPNHPQVKKIEEALRQVQARLAKMSNERTEEVSAINPVFEKVKVNFVQALVERDAAEATLSNLREKSEEANERLRLLNEIQMTADLHQRNVNVARQYLALYTQKLGEAKVMEQLDLQKISDVVIAQTGNLVVKHISPRGSVLLPLGMLMSFALSLATALYFQRNHLSSALSEDEVEQILDIPVLVTLPRVYSVRDMVN